MYDTEVLSGLYLLGPGYSLLPSLTLPREGNLGSWDFPPKNQKEMGRWIRQQGAYEEKDGVPSQGFLQRKERKERNWCGKVGTPLTSIEPLHGWEKEVPLLKIQYFGHLMWRTLKRSWCWERLKAGGEGDDRGWDGWMASLTQWTWIWVNSGSWWWTGRPGVLQSMGWKRVGHDWATELNWVG